MATRVTFSVATVWRVMEFQRFQAGLVLATNILFVFFQRFFLFRNADAACTDMKTSFIEGIWHTEERPGYYSLLL